MSLYINTEKLSPYWQSKKKIEYLDSIVMNDDNDDIEILRKKVKEIIQNLPEKCKLVFELSKKEGLTNVEISEHLNIGVKPVEAQITKAFKTLREELGNRVKAVLFLLFDLKIK